MHNSPFSMLDIPDGGYQVIYADPPWSFSKWSNKSDKANGLAEHHYPTMTMDDIKALPVPDITNKSAVLFMWVVSADLPRCIEVMESWGFTYKTVAFCWTKETKNGLDHFGMGSYTRANVELCLIGTKGKPLPRLKKNIRQLQRHKVDKHSKKPAAIRDLVVELMGNVPRIELFAREEFAGWHAWGNEIGSGK